MGNPIDSPILLWIAVSGFIAAAAAPFLSRWLGRWIGWVLAALPLSIATFLILQLGVVDAETALIYSFEWVPELSVNLSFRLDGLSLVMALLVSGIGALILIYAAAYMEKDASIGRFFFLLLSFMAAMLSLVLADNLLLLFVAWELTSIFSYLLIGHHHELESSRQAARQALVTTGAGGLALLAGLVLLSIAGNSWELSELLQRGEMVQSHALYVPALILVLLGCFTKSAQFPFHYWLPSAMAGPTPVSAYLHSATMVKAGVYLLARVNPILGGTELWFVLLTVVGVTTAVLGGWMAWQQSDMKRIMAYSTISALGTLVMLLGLNSDVALKAAMLFLIVHSLYKGALFMLAGIIDHETGTRDVGQLAGLWRLLPFTLIGGLLATLSMAGIPPLVGFISKELMYEATLGGDRPVWPTIITILTVITNITMVASAAIIIIKPFFGKPTSYSKLPHHKPPFSMWLGPLLLGLIALYFGLFSTTDVVTHQLLEPAVQAVAGHDVKVKLGLWHGLTPYLMLSVVTIVGGGLLYAFNLRLQAPVRRLNDAWSARVGPAQLFERLMDGLLTGATAVTKLFQTGILNHYLTYVFIALVTLVGVTLFTSAEQLLPDTISPIRFEDIAIASVIIAAAYMTLVFRSRLAVIASLGVVGYGIALIYMLYGAPDLAMTQFSIETLTVILFVLILYKLPRFEALTSTRRRWRDGVIAVSVGVLMTLLVLMATSHESVKPLTEYFAANSYELAKGLNVVNVILVDFRGFDTMMEITVLSVAAIGVFALLRNRRRGEDEE